MLNAARKNLRIKNKVDPFPFHLNPAISTHRKQPKPTTTTTSKRKHKFIYVMFFFSVESKRECSYFFYFILFDWWVEGIGK